MLRRVISLTLCSMLVFSIFCSSFLADDSNTYDTCTHVWEQPIDHWYGIPIPGTDITFGVDVERCSKCGLYKHTADLLIAKSTYYSPLPPHLDGIIPSELLTYWMNVYYNIFGKNATPTKAPSGIGRKDLPGYADDNGTATVSSDGKFRVIAEPYGLFGRYLGSGFVFSDSIQSEYLVCSGASGSGTVYPYQYVLPVYTFTAPETGLYYLGSYNGKSQYFSYALFTSNWYSKTFSFGWTSTYAVSKTLNKGDMVFVLGSAVSSIGNITVQNRPFKYQLYPIAVYYEPLGSTVINKQTNITINNNTWSGNIYVDNTTNLTYIYPEYTTINDSGDTVTNISNNPIIYNSETKQYYTYDSVTNNYYYITYGDTPATPTPTPEPSETPSPSPDPDNPGTDPTPTPTPGGNTGGGDSGSGGSSWWDKLLDGIVSGLLGAIKGLLKLLFDLFSSIFGWIVWLVSQVLTLFPFLPPGVGPLIVGGVVVCFILAIIKFIRG